jgi:hypothetical protein
MTTYAYLRVSTDQQDVDNQRYGLFLYANIHGLGPLQFVEDTASGRLAWRDRVVGRLLTETVHAGDSESHRRYGVGPGGGDRTGDDFPADHGGPGEAESGRPPTRTATRDASRAHEARCQRGGNPEVFGERDQQAIHCQTG